MSVIRALTMGALFAGALACAPTSLADLLASATPVDADAIDQVIQQRMDEAGLVGVGAAIIVDPSPAMSNSGIFWSTKFNVSRVGHGGVDPGVRTEMLADLSGRVGVVLFANTSVSGPDTKVYASLLDELWRHAAAFEAPPRMIRAPR